VESLALRRELGDKWGIANTLDLLGDLAGEQGDYAAAQGLLAESLILQRELGDKWGIANTLDCLGRVAQAAGDYAAARALFVESLLLRRELGIKAKIAASLLCLGGLVVACAASMGSTGPTGADLERGPRLLGAAEGLFAALDVALWSESRVPHARAVAAARALLGEEAFARARQEGRAMTMEQAIAYGCQGRL
jgi:hypothetical protein